MMQPAWNLSREPIRTAETELSGFMEMQDQAGASTLAYELKFKALTAGTSQITVKEQEVYDADSKLVTVDQQGQSKVTVTAEEGPLMMLL